MHKAYCEDYKSTEYPSINPCGAKQSARVLKTIPGHIGGMQVFSSLDQPCSPKANPIRPKHLKETKSQETFVENLLFSLLTISFYSL